MWNNNYYPPGACSPYCPTPPSSPCGGCQPYNPCPIFVNTSCVQYTGGNLTCSGILTNDTLSTIITKINSKLCVPYNTSIFITGANFNTDHQTYVNTSLNTTFNVYLNGVRFFSPPFINGVANNSPEFVYIGGGGFIFTSYIVNPTDQFVIIP